MLLFTQSADSLTNPPSLPCHFDYQVASGVGVGATVLKEECIDQVKVWPQQLETEHLILALPPTSIKKKSIETSRRNPLKSVELHWHKVAFIEIMV